MSFFQLSQTVPAELERRAIDARTRAYAPYSKFRVGCALLVSGKIFEGANIENASYSLCICAERTAMAYAAASGSLELQAVTVCTEVSPPSSPCGACRQFLYEFAADPAKVVVTAIHPSTGEKRTWTLAELLPAGFSGRELPSE